jgi:hypothetical protein
VRSPPSRASSRARPAAHLGPAEPARPPAPPARGGFRGLAAPRPARPHDEEADGRKARPRPPPGMVIVRELFARTWGRVAARSRFSRPRRRRHGQGRKPSRSGRFREALHLAPRVRGSPARSPRMSSRSSAVQHAQSRQAARSRISSGVIAASAQDVAKPDHRGADPGLHRAERLAQPLRDLRWVSPP